jgi:hypothetical protein
MKYYIPLKEPFYLKELAWLDFSDQLGQSFWSSCSGHCLNGFKLICVIVNLLLFLL